MNPRANRSPPGRHSHCTPRAPMPTRYPSTGIRPKPTTGTAIRQIYCCHCFQSDSIAPPTLVQGGHPVWTLLELAKVTSRYAANTPDALIDHRRCW